MVGNAKRKNLVVPHFFSTFAPAYQPLIMGGRQNGGDLWVEYSCGMSSDCYRDYGAVTLYGMLNTAIMLSGNY